MMLAVALLAPVGGAAAGTAPARQTLAGLTTIRWTGTAKIALTVPRNVERFTEDRMRLFVKGGTYAFVRIVSPLSPYCPRVGEPAHCSTIKLDYIADLAKRMNYPTLGPGHDHVTDLAFDPPFLDKGLTTFFLFTNGQATLEIRPPGLTGATSYVARDRFRGKAERLPVRCTSGMCSPTSVDPLLYGGTSFDLGKSPGSVDMLVFSTTVNQDLVPGVVPANQPHGLRQCIYPNYLTAPNASPNASDHSFGCDLTPKRSDEAAGVAFATADELGSAAPGGTGLMFRWGFTDVSGPRYAGWHAASAGPAPAIRSAYAVWYSYIA